MYVDSCTYKANGKKYTRHLLRESYRKGKKVYHRTVANISHCPDDVIKAIKLALKHKNNLQEIGNINENIKSQQGKSFGAVWTLWQVAQRIGLVKALGSSQNGKQALWQVFARVLEQGSRLSAVRLANTHTACDILGLKQFNEDSLYKNLDWLADNQAKIEDRLFKQRYQQDKPDLYLYDVTSSYLEGVCNTMAAFGYNRDKKKGKQQIVYGLLCDPHGIPVSIEAFKGNTSDTQTFGSQIKKVLNRFDAKVVTMVGDRGMIKGPQIAQLQSERDGIFHYITAITKSQIETLIKKDFLQMSLFDETLVEVTDNDTGIRYIMRYNPCRAAEIANTRNSKWAKLQKLVNERNKYLQAHARADVDVAKRNIEGLHKSLRLPEISITVKSRVITIAQNEDIWQDVSKLDGCYCLKTDLSKDDASKETVHDRYKDLSQVEWAFRTSKTTMLEARPVYVCLESRTRGHLLVVMLAYLLVQELTRCWRKIDLTVEEGLSQLKSLCTTQLTVKGCAVLNNIPTPRDSVQQLLDTAGVVLPKAIKDCGVNVSTRKKLTKERKVLDK
jgi:transposase